MTTERKPDDEQVETTVEAQIEGVPLVHYGDMRRGCIEDRRQYLKRNGFKNVDEMSVNRVIGLSNRLADLRGPVLPTWDAVETYLETVLAGKPLSHEEVKAV